MDILLTVNSQKREFQELFSGHDLRVATRKDLEGGTKVDLIIFPGGADVHPSRYNYPTPEHGDFDQKRDEFELNILQAALTGVIKTEKIFGVCRGLQLLNVGLGGTLVYDILQKCRVDHPMVHSLDWMSNPIAKALRTFFPYVNSVHHQAVDNMGGKLSKNLLAYEPNTSIIEAVVWSNKILGVQWHPEWMPKNDRMEGFVKWMENWVGESKPQVPGVVKVEGTGNTYYKPVFTDFEPEDYD